MPFENSIELFNTFLMVTTVQMFSSHFSHDANLLALACWHTLASTATPAPALAVMRSSSHHILFTKLASATRVRISTSMQNIKSSRDPVTTAFMSTRLHCEATSRFLTKASCNRRSFFQTHFALKSAFVIVMAACGGSAFPSVAMRASTNSY